MIHTDSWISFQWMSGPRVTASTLRPTAFSGFESMSPSGILAIHWFHRHPGAQYPPHYNKTRYSHKVISGGAKVFAARGKGPWCRPSNRQHPSSMHWINEKALRETQTLRAGCSRWSQKKFAPPQTISRGRRTAKI